MASPAKTPTASSSRNGANYDIQTIAAFNSLVSEIMVLCEAPSSTRPELESLLSRYMKQGGDFASLGQMLLSSKERNLGNQINETGPRSLQLMFLTEICQPVFTGVPIKGEHFQPLMVALIDGQSGEVVTFGPEASARVEIVGLNADFGGCLGGSWTPEDFKSKIVTGEGNKRLLTGDVVLDLKEGIGRLGMVRFSHTKIWKKQHAYRLGAVAVDDYIRTKIREGFTESFFVKDQRLDLNRKHYPPSLSDDVWRLVGIARDGAFHQRLRDDKVNINNVEDFLKKLNTDPQTLRDILGKGMSAKMWEALVEHARTCIVAEKIYLYSSSDCLPKTSVLFNTVGQVMGLISESQYVSFEMLSESAKAHATKLVASAFQQWEKVVSFDDEVSFDKYLRSSQIVYHLRSPIVESSSAINILMHPSNDELVLPQPAISFDDKASLFDESPGMSNIVFPPKSPTIERSSGSKILISPKIDELGFPNPDASFDDERFIFDESPSPSIISSPASPIKESSSGTQILVSQKSNQLFPPPDFSLDDDSILFDKSPGSINNICPPISPILDFPQPVVLSQEIIPACDSVWDMSYYNDCYSQCVDLDHQVHRHVRHCSYSSQMTDSDNGEMESMIQSWWEENHDIPLQFSVDDVSLDTRGLTLESVDTLQNDGNGPPMTSPTVALMNNARKRYLRNKAKRKWRVLFSVVRWLFVCRNTADKLLVGRLQVKLSSSYQDLQALDSGDSGHKPLTRAGDFVISTSHETKGFQIFGSQAPVLSRNLSMKSEANLHSTVNDILLARSVAVATNIAQRKYMSKREKARRRWTKLYSVMRWFWIQRNVTKRAPSALTVRDPSCSSSIGGLSAIWAMDSSSYDGFVSGRDMSPSPQSSTNFACSFHEDEYVQLFNALCSLQPRNRIAMNRLARRRNAADESFAKRKWRMLFSIMKWLSVRRSASRVKGPRNIC